MTAAVAVPVDRVNCPPPPPPPPTPRPPKLHGSASLFDRLAQAAAAAAAPLPAESLAALRHLLPPVQPQES